MMFSFLFAGMILLLLLLPGVAGVVLLVVGLARRRPALWGSGIALMALALLGLLVGAGFAFYATARVAGPPMAVPTPAVITGDLADDFATYTFLTLPNTAEIIATQRSSHGVSEGVVYLAKLKVEPTFGSFLTENFQPATWDDVRADMTTEAGEHGLWAPDDLKDRAYHSRSVKTVEDGQACTVRTHVAHDAAGKAAYVVSIRDPNS
jgi:hypothetical protein